MFNFHLRQPSVMVGVGGEFPTLRLGPEPLSQLSDPFQQVFNYENENNNKTIAINRNIITEITTAITQLK